MSEAKQKKPVRRVKKAANSPIPSGPMSDMGGGTCGHSGCSTGSCKVRFVGPTSNMRDHHIMHAARGAAQVWTAAIVAGLAVVLTGAIAYTAVQAQTDSATGGDGTVLQQLVQINKRLSNIEALLKGQRVQGTPSTVVPTPKERVEITTTTRERVQFATSTEMTAGNIPVKTCLESCAKTTAECAKTAGEDATAKRACLDQDAACRKTCAPVK